VRLSVIHSPVRRNAVVICMETSESNAVNKRPLESIQHSYVIWNSPIVFYSAGRVSTGPSDHAPSDEHAAIAFKDFSVKAVMVWNSLPFNCWSAQSLFSYQRILKTDLFLYCILVAYQVIIIPRLWFIVWLCRDTVVSIVSCRCTYCFALKPFYGKLIRPYSRYCAVAFCCVHKWELFYMSWSWH